MEVRGELDQRGIERPYEAEEGTGSPTYVISSEPVTGDKELDKKFKIIDYKFDKYDILVKLSPFGEFLGIIEVKVNSDFRSYKQRLSFRTPLDEIDDSAEE